MGIPEQDLTLLILVWTVTLQLILSGAVDPQAELKHVSCQY